MKKDYLSKNKNWKSINSPKIKGGARKWENNPFLSSSKKKDTDPLFDSDIDTYFS